MVYLYSSQVISFYMGFRTPLKVIPWLFQLNFDFMAYVCNKEINWF